MDIEDIDGITFYGMLREHGYETRDDLVQAAQNATNFAALDRLGEGADAEIYGEVAPDLANDAIVHLRAVATPAKVERIAQASGCKTTGGLKALVRDGYELSGIDGIGQDTELDILRFLI